MKLLPISHLYKNLFMSQSELKSGCGAKCHLFIHVASESSLCLSGLSRVAVLRVGPLATPTSCGFHIIEKYRKVCLLCFWITSKHKISVVVAKGTSSVLLGEGECILASPNQHLVHLWVSLLELTPSILLCSCTLLESQTSTSNGGWLQLTKHRHG